MNYNFTPTRQTQDWQLDAYEMRGKHNTMIRHQRVINEMEYSRPQTTRVDSEVKR
jgi:hypothetical protein